MQTSAACQAIALRQENTFEPAWKCGRFAKLSKLLPSYDERLLRCVLREVDVAQHGKRTTESHVLKANHEFAKCFVSYRERATRISGPQNNIFNVFHLKLAR